MADLSDVEIAIGEIAAAALYPNGTGSASAIGAACKVMRGWPEPQDVDDTMKAGNVMVSVFPMPGMERNTTRFPTDLNTLSIPAATVTAAISGNAITFAGTVSAAQNVGVIIGDYAPTQQAFVYPAALGDTPATIAAGLAALMVAGAVSATASGAVLTLPDNLTGIVRVGTFGTAWQELRRQERVVMTSLWCPTPELRDAAAKVVDLALVQNERFALSDGSGAKMTYQRTSVSDDRQTVAMYRRDLIYMVEYPTVVISTFTQVIATNVAASLSH